MIIADGLGWRDAVPMPCLVVPLLVLVAGLVYLLVADWWENKK